MGAIAGSMWELEPLRRKAARWLSSWASQVLRYAAPCIPTPVLACCCINAGRTVHVELSSKFTAYV